MMDGVKSCLNVRGLIIPKAKKGVKDRSEWRCILKVGKQIIQSEASCMMLFILWKILCASLQKIKNYLCEQSMLCMRSLRWVTPYFLEIGHNAEKKKLKSHRKQVQSVHVGRYYIYIYSLCYFLFAFKRISVRCVLWMCSTL